MSAPTRFKRTGKEWGCIMCCSGKGHGGLLYLFDENWFGSAVDCPEECPQCGSQFGIMPADDARRLIGSADVPEAP